MWHIYKSVQIYSFSGFFGSYPIIVVSVSSNSTLKE